METEPVFEEFRKIARLRRECVITEKIDGTNGQIYITDDNQMFIGSRNRWLTPEKDNFGFARWAREHESELLKLGPGRHFGEWWGNGIQRGYGLPNGDKRFSLFNTSKWSDPAVRPGCCGVVPVLCQGSFSNLAVDMVLFELRTNGSRVAPFMNPEGIVVYHTHANTYFKVTLENDDVPKTRVQHATV